MKHRLDLPPPMPPHRKEREEAPLSPRLIVEISRLLRARMLCDEEGVMAQSTARLIMSNLALHKVLGQQELVRITRLKPPSVSVMLSRMACREARPVVGVDLANPAPNSVICMDSSPNG